MDIEGNPGVVPVADCLVRISPVRHAVVVMWRTRHNGGIYELHVEAGGQAYLNLAEGEVIEVRRSGLRPPPPAAE